MTEEEKRRQIIINGGGGLTTAATEPQNQDVAFAVTWFAPVNDSDYRRADAALAAAVAAWTAWTP